MQFVLHLPRRSDKPTIISFCFYLYLALSDTINPSYLTFTYAFQCALRKQAVSRFQAQCHQIIYFSHLRDHSYRMSTKVLGFWAPSLPLVRISRNLSVLFVPKIWRFLNLRADVLYEWALSKRYRRNPALHSVQNRQCTTILQPTNVKIMRRLPRVP